MFRSTRGIALSKCLRTNAFLRFNFYLIFWARPKKVYLKLPRMETADPKRPPPPKKKKRPQPRHMQWCQPYNCIHPIPSHPTNEELFATRRPSWATSHGDQSRMGCFRRTGSTFCGANRWKTESFKRPLASIKRIGASNMLICAWLSLRIKSPK